MTHNETFSKYSKSPQKERKKKEVLFSLLPQISKLKEIKNQYHELLTQNLKARRNVKGHTTKVIFNINNKLFGKQKESDITKSVKKTFIRSKTIMDCNLNEKNTRSKTIDSNESIDNFNKSYIEGKLDNLEDEIIKNPKRELITPLPEIQKYNNIVAEKIKRFSIMLRRQEYTVELKKKNMSNLFRKKIIFIQRFWRKFFKNVYLKKVIKIQKHYRGYKIRKMVKNDKLTLIRLVVKISLLGRQKHFHFFIGQIKKLIRAIFFTHLIDTNDISIQVNVTHENIKQNNNNENIKNNDHNEDLKDINDNNEDLKGINDNNEVLKEINDNNEDLKEINDNNEDIKEINDNNEDLKEINDNNEDLKEINDNNEDLKEINDNNEDLKEIHDNNEDIKDNDEVIQNDDYYQITVNKNENNNFNHEHINEHINSHSKENLSKTSENNGNIYIISHENEDSNDNIYIFNDENIINNINNENISRKDENNESKSILHFADSDSDSDDDIIYNINSSSRFISSNRIINNESENSENYNIKENIINNNDRINHNIQISDKVKNQILDGIINKDDIKIRFTNKNENMEKNIKKEHEKDEILEKMNNSKDTFNNKTDNNFDKENESFKSDIKKDNNENMISHEKSGQYENSLESKEKNDIIIVNNNFDNDFENNLQNFMLNEDLINEQKYENNNNNNFSDFEEYLKKRRSFKSLQLINETYESFLTRNDSDNQNKTVNKEQYIETIFDKITKLNKKGNIIGIKSFPRPYVEIGNNLKALQKLLFKPNYNDEIIITKENDMKYIGQTNQLIVDFLNKSVTVNKLKNNDLAFVKLNDNKKIKELLYSQKNLEDDIEGRKTYLKSQNIKAEEYNILYSDNYMNLIRKKVANQNWSHVLKNNYIRIGYRRLHFLQKEIKKFLKKVRLEKEEVKIRIDTKIKLFNMLFKDCILKYIRKKVFKILRPIIKKKNRHTNSLCISRGNLTESNCFQNKIKLSRNKRLNKKKNDLIETESIIENDEDIFIFFTTDISDPEIFQKYNLTQTDMKSIEQI